MRILNRDAFPVFIAGVFILFLGVLWTAAGYIFLPQLLIFIGAFFIYGSALKQEKVREYRRGIIDSKTDEVILYVSIIALIVFFTYLFL